MRRSIDEITGAGPAGGMTLPEAVPDGAADRAGITALARDTVEFLLGRLERTVDDSLDTLRAFFSRPDLTPEQKIEEVRMDFTRAEAMSYDSAPRNSFYLCRYAVAYAFEYAMLYDLALRLRLESGSGSFGVFSFGAGTFLDAWSLAYAKARLTAENPAYDRIKLYYKGVDEQAWNTYFIQPARSYSGESPGEYEECRFGDPLIDGLFEKVWFYNWSIDRFLREDILSRPQKNFYYNTLVFPKIINELEDEDVEKLVGAMEQVRFPYDEYYLIVSHSARQRNKSAEILLRLIRAIDPDGAFEVCCDCEELLGPDSRRAFARAWLGRDSLVSLAGEDARPLKCYAFASVVNGRENGYDPGVYIDRHNAHFTYDAPKEYLRNLDDGSGLRANQVRTVSQIVFDVVRLRRREGQGPD